MSSLQEIRFDIGIDNADFLQRYDMNTVAWKRAIPMLRAFAQKGGILSQISLFSQYRKVSRVKLNKWEVTIEWYRKTNTGSELFNYPEAWTLVLRSIIDKPVEYICNEAYNVVCCSELDSP